MLLCFFTTIRWSFFFSGGQRVIMVTQQWCSYTVTLATSSLIVKVFFWCTMPAYKQCSSLASLVTGRWLKFSWLIMLNTDEAPLPSFIDHWKLVKAFLVHYVDASLAGNRLKDGEWNSQFQDWYWLLSPP